MSPLLTHLHHSHSKIQGQLVLLRLGILAGSFNFNDFECMGKNLWDPLKSACVGGEKFPITTNTIFMLQLDSCHP